MKRSRRLLIFLFLVIALPIDFFAGQAKEAKGGVQEKPADQARSKFLFIKGGTVYTITKGVIHGGAILVGEGKIEKVGKDLIPPEGASVLNAEGKWIMPGFVVAQTSSLALTGLARDDRDPKLLNYLDPYSLQVRLCLASGITAYSPSLFAGTGPARKSYTFVNAVIKPAYGRLRDMLINEPAYLLIDIARLRPSEKEELRGFFQQARESMAKEEESEKAKVLGGEKPPAPPSPQIKNYVDILKGKLAVRFAADRKKDILKALSFVDEFGVRGQILGAAEGWLLPQEIGRRNISTILQPEGFFEPDRYRSPSGGSNIRNAAIQNEGGIKFALLSTSVFISTGGTLGTDLLTFPLAGSYAIRGGLGEADALRAITLWPAELLGMSHRLGSIEEGKDADIIILDGNPFDYRTYVDYTIINGEILYDKSKSTFFENIPKPKRIF
jgi:hypothetical protein